MYSIAKLRATYVKKHTSDANFPQPRTYEDRGPRISISRLEPSSGPIDLYVRNSPTLLRVKNQMVPWLWTAYNVALSSIDIMDEFWDESAALGPGFFTRTKDRECPMKDALVMAPTYPPRPAELLAPSPSVDKVRAVLADAAKLPSKKDWGRKDLPGLAVISDYDEEGEPACEYRWSDDYLERLFTTLIEVVEEHGTGPEGFEGIRWEVYDRVRTVMPPDLLMLDGADSTCPAVRQGLDDWSALRSAQGDVDGRHRCGMARWSVRLARRYLSLEMCCWEAV